MLALSSPVFADCSDLEQSLYKQRLRADVYDPVKGRIIFGESLLQAEYMLKDCLKSNNRFTSEESRRAKLPAPRIGQRKQDINWGHPTATSTTTTAKGVVEIQSYPGGNVLMYVNGILTAIQQTN